MGVFELAPFAEGTRAVAQGLIDSGAFTVIGGGDTTAAMRALGFAAESFGYLSTGGGASLEYLEGRELPGLTALQDAAPVLAAPGGRDGARGRAIPAGACGH